MRIGPRKINITGMNRQMGMKHMLRMRGLKASMPRIAIYEAFQSSPEPLSAEEIYEQIEIANIATVHRVLEVLEKANLIKNIGKLRKPGSPHGKRRTHYHIL